jgi:hypothetical protein
MKVMLIWLIIAGFLAGPAAQAEDTNRFLTFGPTVPDTAAPYYPWIFQQIIEEAKTAPESRPAAEDPEGHWGGITEGLQLSVRFQRDALLFSADEITNLNSLAAKLCNPPVGDGLARFLWTNLSSSSHALLSAYRGGADTNLAQALVDDLNRIIRGNSIYDAGRFAGTNLSWGTQQNLQGRSATFELNRALLQDAYPLEFGRSRNLARDTFKVGEPVWAMVLIRNSGQATAGYPEIWSEALDSRLCEFNVLTEGRQAVARLGKTNVTMISPQGRDLVPGSQRKYMVLLNGRFDLRAPGHYTVQATKGIRTEGGGVATLESGVAPLTIVP